MRIAFLFAVSLECVGVRKLFRGGEHDCSVPYCAWKASRFFTGSFASTAQPQWALHNAVRCRMEPVVRVRFCSVVCFSFIFHKMSSAYKIGPLVFIHMAIFFCEFAVIFFYEKDGISNHTILISEIVCSVFEEIWSFHGPMVFLLSF